MDDINGVLSKVPKDQLRAMVGILLNIPLGFIGLFLPTKTVRMLYCIIFGLMIQYYVYGKEMYHLALASLVNLFIILYAENSRKGHYCFAYNMLHNSVLNLLRLFTDPEHWEVEISWVFMTTILKFTGFAYSYQDGKLSKESKENELSSTQKKYKIEDFSLLEYFSFVYFHATAVLGLYYEFNDFKNFIERKEEYKEIPKFTMIGRALARFATGILFLVIFTIFEPYSNLEIIISPETPPLKKLYSYVLAIIYEWRYIYGFCFMEIGAIASGITYEGKEENSKSVRDYNTDINNKGKCIKIIDLHLVYTPSEFFKNWNVSVHYFFKRHVFQRRINKNSTNDEKAAASLLVFFTSAFWHGFNINYFILFGNFYLVTCYEKNSAILFNKLNWRPPNFLLNLLRIFILMFIIQYHCLIMLCLDTTKLALFLRTCYGFCTLGLLALNVLIFLLNKLYRNKKKE